MDVRIGSTATRRGASVALVAVPLAASVAVLSWRGVADPLDGLALLALGFGLLTARWWLR